MRLFVTGSVSGLIRLELTQVRVSMQYLPPAGLNSNPTLADAIMDRISYDSYKIDIESVDPSKDLSMREVYGLDPAMAK